MMQIKSLSLFSLLFFFALLPGCSGDADSQTKNFVRDTKGQKAGRLEPLPNFPKYEPYAYSSPKLRSPFEPVTTLAEKPSLVVKIGPTPDLNRPRELLESYPLDSLQMVGTLERTGNFYALLKDMRGIVHLVTIGNYVGQNFGRIEKINEKEIEVKEWIQDNQGGWQPRAALLRLTK